MADFGVSRVDGDSPGLTESGVVVGSYQYMPPEQARACRTATEAADQYALGAILYECVTGKRPFEGNSPYDLTHAILHAPLVPPTERNAELPAALDAVLLHAMNRDPDSRFPSVDDLAAALLPFAKPEVARRWASEFSCSTAEKETMAPVASRLHGGPPPRRLGPVAVAVGAIVCAGVVFGVVAFGERPVAFGGPAAWFGLQGAFHHSAPPRQIEASFGPSASSVSLASVTGPEPVVPEAPQPPPPFSQPVAAPPPAPERTSYGRAKARPAAAPGAPRAQDGGARTRDDDLELNRRE